jgi:hypothetical protein
MRRWIWRQADQARHRGISATINIDHRAQSTAIYTGRTWTTGHATVDANGTQLEYVALSTGSASLVFSGALR